MSPWSTDLAAESPDLAPRSPDHAADPQTQRQGPRTEPLISRPAAVVRGQSRKIPRLSARICGSSGGISRSRAVPSGPQGRDCVLRDYDGVFRDLSGGRDDDPRSHRPIPVPLSVREEPQPQDPEGLLNRPPAARRVPRQRARRDDPGGGRQDGSPRLHGRLGGRPPRGQLLLPQPLREPSLRAVRPHPPPQARQDRRPPPRPHPPHAAPLPGDPPLGGRGGHQVYSAPTRAYVHHDDPDIHGGA